MEPMTSFSQQLVAEAGTELEMLKNCIVYKAEWESEQKECVTWVREQVIM